MLPANAPKCLGIPHSAFIIRVMRPRSFVRAMHVAREFHVPLAQCHRTIGRQMRERPRYCIDTRTIRQNSSSTKSAEPFADSPASLTPEQYHKLSDTYIEMLLTDFEELQEVDEEVDVEYSAGVLNLKIPDKGTYVINKQPPNKQIWLSSPLSGPKRYDYVLPASQNISAESASQTARESTKDVEGGEWIYLRDGSGLSDLLRDELGVDLNNQEEP